MTQRYIVAACDQNGISRVYAYGSTLVEALEQLSLEMAKYERERPDLRLAPNPKSYHVVEG